MPRNSTSGVLPHLLREQSNAVLLYLRYKGYHWNVSGPWFRELHLLFDEHAATVLASVDPLAERQRMLAAPAIYTLAELAAAASLLPDHSLPSTPREMLERLGADHRAVIDGLHRGFQAAELAGDPGTADLFTRLVQEHEKMEWFVREQLVEAGPLEEGAPGLVAVGSNRARLLSSRTPDLRPAAGHR